MSSRGIFTKILAVSGTILIWFPIFATLVTGAAVTIRAKVLHFDYLMPAELFPAALLGGGLLLWAALRLRSRRKMIGWSLGAMIALLFGSQAFAMVSGLASGRTEPAGWMWGIVIGMLAGYTLAIMVGGVAGVLLLNHLFSKEMNGAMLAD